MYNLYKRYEEYANFEYIKQLVKGRWGIPTSGFVMEVLNAGGRHQLKCDRKVTDALQKHWPDHDGISGIEIYVCANS